VTDKERISVAYSNGKMALREDFIIKKKN